MLFMVENHCRSHFGIALVRRIYSTYFNGHLYQEAGVNCLVDCLHKLRHASLFHSKTPFLLYIHCHFAMH